MVNRRSRTSAVLTLAMLVLAACAHRPAGPTRTTRSPPALASITPASFASFRERFNQSADRTRVLMLVSPT